MITVTGSVGASDVSKFREHLLAIVTEEHRSVSVDLRNTAHVNPAIVPVLLEAGSRLSREGSTLNVHIGDGVTANVLQALAPKELLVVQREGGDIEPTPEN